MTPVLLHWIAVVAALAGAILALQGLKRVQLARLRMAAGPDAAIEDISVWRILVAPLARRMRPRGNELDALVAELQQAGRHDKEEIDRFFQEKILSLLLGTGAGAGLGVLVGDMVGVLLLFIGITAGLVMPRRRLLGRATQRRDAIAASLPSAIDLLMTSVDAGLSVDQAIARVARELSRSSPILCQELSMAAAECEAGVALTEALRHLARRVELDDLSGLCGVVSQAHELGAPIVETLADYADSSRKLRMAMLEERAGKLVTKLTFPLALFLLPACLVAMLGPAALQLIEVLK